MDLVENERSWQTRVINDIYSIIENNNLLIKEVAGELNIRSGNGLFPDVLLFSDSGREKVLQGWELKMPDTDINDYNFIENAKEKARILGVNSFFLWNFSYGVLYIKDNSENFKVEKTWKPSINIQNRDDVKIYREEWEKQIEDIIFELNNYFISGKIVNSSLQNIISINTISTIIKRNKNSVADFIKKSARKNAVIAAFISDWWEKIREEYSRDESDEYVAYGKKIILSWIIKLIFANVIKFKQNDALIINQIDEKSTIEDVQNIFCEITNKCDFYNVFSKIEYEELLPVDTWNDFIEFELFLKTNQTSHLKQEILQNVLEQTVATGRREINGQYTTPQELAVLLSNITIINWEGTVLDCCCGTGTIPNVILEKKKSIMNIKDALASVWVSDKNDYPLQIANISITDADTINVPNRLFKHNALNLKLGEEIDFKDQI